MTDIMQPDQIAISAFLPDAVRRRVEALSPHYMDMSEVELARLMPHQRFSVQDKRLRVSFWTEYHRATGNNVSMSLEKVCVGICTRRHFLEQVCANPVRLSFMLIPPTDYRIALEESLDTLVSKMRDIADLPVTDEKGNPLHKNIDVIMKAFAHIDNRVKGAAVQRIESKSVTVSATAPSTVKDIDARLQELEHKANKAAIPADPGSVRIGVIDVPMVEKSDADETP